LNLEIVTISGAKQIPLLLDTQQVMSHAPCSFLVNRRLRFNNTHNQGGSQNSYSAEDKTTQSLLSSCTALHQMPAENKLGSFGLSCSFKITYEWERQ